MRKVVPRLTTLAVLANLLCAGCAQDGADRKAPSRVLRLAVTTSTRDSGLLDRLVPVFEKTNNVRVDVIAVGTGKALKLGEAGDVDVVLVHARAAEDAFMAAGHGIRREEVMYNTFEILGPPSDPAAVKGLSAVAALTTIASKQQRFVSRGDESGTHKRELALWKAGSGRPDWSEYIESGQGMGSTLIMADQMQAYVLADRGTYLKFRKKLSLIPLASQSEDLKNVYGVIVVNPSRDPRINGELAQTFVDFIISPPTQRIIRDFQVDGEQLFHPLRPLQ